MKAAVKAGERNEAVHTRGRGVVSSNGGDEPEWVIAEGTIKGGGVRCLASVKAVVEP